MGEDPIRRDGAISRRCSHTARPSLGDPAGLHATVSQGWRGSYAAAISRLAAVCPCTVLSMSMSSHRSYRSLGLMYPSAVWELRDDFPQEFGPSDCCCMRNA